MRLEPKGDEVYIHRLSDQFVQAGGLVHYVSKCGCVAYQPVGCKL